MSDYQFTDVPAAIKEAQTRANEDRAIYCVTKADGKYCVRLRAEMSYPDLQTVIYAARPFGAEYE